MQKGASFRNPSTGERVVTLTKDGTCKLTNEKKRSFTAPSNEVHTSKYTYLPSWNMFLIKIPMEQLRRGVNQYFLLSCFIMFLGHNTTWFIGTIKASSTFVVLMGMISISAMVSLIDDYYRRQADTAMNAQKVECLSLTSLTRGSKKWAEVKVGDVLIIKKDEEVPADAVILCSSNSQGFAYVSTSSLDGETSLKLQVSCKKTNKLAEGVASLTAEKFGGKLKEQLKAKGLSVKAEPPNPNIHSFQGVLTLGDETDDLDKSQFILRGSKLSNTKWVVVLVVYTGADTRIVRNTTQTPSKLSHLESVNNKAIVVTGLAQVGISLVSCIMHQVAQTQFLDYWYLYPTREPEYVALPGAVAWFFSFFTLYSNMVPISLYSTMEMVNFFQARAITLDGAMKAEGKSAKVRSTNLCQEIGQVTHIFSDKTGTLTKNKMTTKAFCILKGSKAEVFRMESPQDETNLKKEVTRGNAEQLMQVLSVAHTVMVAKDESGNSELMSESPDEKALVESAKYFGWEFEDRNGDEVLIKGRKTPIKVLATNAFSSSRARMSVLVQMDGKYKLFVKGSDTVMLERTCKYQSETEIAALKSTLNMFAEEGLRTLLVGTKDITKQLADELVSQWNAAKISMEARDLKVDQAAEEMEKDLTLIGATAIEDELQDKVGETIERIRQAGIQLWVLTGDKLETARTIGFSTKVLRKDNMAINVINDNATTAAMDQTFSDILEYKKKELIKIEEAEKSKNSNFRVTESAMMITGTALTKVAQDPKLQRLFLDAANACSVVIACRVAPKQKADLVGWVRFDKKLDKDGKDVTPNRVTLAIGDGANDVPMIQCAEVGVGIYGREGHQAVNSADFALAEFQFLQRLLLIHGRWNYRRTCKFVLYTFWRCVVQVLLCFFFTFKCGFAATILFHDNIRLSYNVVLSPVIVAVGIFDRDVADKFVLDRPSLYAPGPQDEDLNAWRMFQQLLSATCHAMIIWWTMSYAYTGMNMNNAGDLYTYGTAVWTVLIFDCLLRGMFLTITWTVWNFLFLFGSVGMYVCMLSVMCKSSSSMLVGSHVWMMSKIFGITLIAAPLLGLVLDHFIEGLRIRRYPEKVDNEMMKALTLYKDAKNSGNKEILAQTLGTRPSEIGLVPNEIAPDFDINYKKTGKFYRIACNHCIYESNFGVFKEKEPPWQRLHFQLFHTDKTGARLGLYAVPIFFLLGAFVIWNAWNAKEVTVCYDGDGEGCFPCPYDSTCTVPVTLDEDFENPALYYKVEPFYQNYLVYASSYSMMELRGLEPSQKEIDACNSTPTTYANSNGTQLVPCGLIAASLFNDTFRFAMNTGIDINTTDIARPSEVKSDDSLFKNPSTYPESFAGEKDVMWLSKRYPGLISDSNETGNVRDEKFAVWNRISAMDWVMNPIGRVMNKTLPKGTYNLTIVNNFRPGPGAEKRISLIQPSSLGVIDIGLGRFLIIAGLLNLLAAMYSEFGDQKQRMATAEEAFAQRGSQAGGTDLEAPLLDKGKAGATVHPGEILLDKDKARST